MRRPAEAIPRFLPQALRVERCGFLDVLPVSYTHLDVYKRQERNESAAICLLFCKWRFAIDCILEDKLQHCQNAKYKDSIKPVSYTHLDVYKRQATGRS